MSQSSNFIKTVVVLSSTLLVATGLYATQCTDTEAFLNDRGRGWFWGERCIKPQELFVDKNTTNGAVTQEEEPKYRIIPTTVSIPWELLDQIDPDDIAKLETESKKIAIQYPTQENIREYKLLQKWLSDKSFSFMAANMQATQTDTELAKWKAQTPVNSLLGLREFRKQNIKLKDQTIRSFSEKVSILVVTAQGCGYCERQKPILKIFKEKHGISYIEKDIDSIPGAIQTLGVATTPDMFIVYNDNGSPIFARMGTGLHPVSDMEDGFLMALRSIGKLDADKDKIIFGRN